MLKCRSGNITLLLKTLQSFPNDEQGLPYLNPPTSLSSSTCLSSQPRNSLCSTKLIPGVICLRALVLGVSLGLECSPLEVMRLSHSFPLSVYLKVTFSVRTSHTPSLNYYQSLRPSPIHILFSYSFAYFSQHLP